MNKNERRFKIKRVNMKINMNKLFLTTFLLGVLVFSTGGVLANAGNQPVEGDVSDFLNLSISPLTLSFGSIPFGAVDQPGSDITLSTPGSDTESNSIDITVSLSGSNADFFTALLQMKKSTEPTFVPVASLGTLQVPDNGGSLVLNTKLMGDSSAFGAGPKNALVVYTFTGTPPSTP